MVRLIDHRALRRESGRGQQRGLVLRSERKHEERQMRSDRRLGKSIGGIALPGTTCDGFLKCGTIHATVRCSFGILVRSGPMPF